MRRIRKRVVGLVLALTLLAAEAVLVSAADLPGVQARQQDEGTTSNDSNPGEGFEYGVVQTPKTRSLVVEDGVRLRQGPSTSAPVLELMYCGETVLIDRTTSSKVPGWYYLKRLSTGTWGWASSDYIMS